MTKSLRSLALSILIAASSRGGTAPPPLVLERHDASEIFAKGSKELETVAGVFYFFDRGDNDGPSALESC